MLTSVIIVKTMKRKITSCYCFRTIQKISDMSYNTDLTTIKRKTRRKTRRNTRNHMEKLNVISGNKDDKSNISHEFDMVQWDTDETTLGICISVNLIVVINVVFTQLTTY